MLPLYRTRLALALVACVAVALELALMRGLAIRFSSHFAGIVISNGLLGFGAAGSFLTLFRTYILKHQRGFLVLLAFALAAAVPFTWWQSQQAPLNVNYLAWSMSEVPHVLRIELLMLLPFFFAGAFIGIALMDSPGRISGHYASDLAGSAVGGVVAVLAMNGLTIAQLLLAIALAGIVGALLLLRWRNTRHLALAVMALILTARFISIMPADPAPNQYKPLTVARLLAGTETLYQTQGPLGRIDVVAGPYLHGAPQLSLGYFDDLPPHAEMYIDGDGPGLIFDCKTPADWVFADYRTAALPFQVWSDNRSPKVCVLSAGGGVDIGLALYHHASSITALELNPQVISAMTGPLATRGGNVYTQPGVTVLNQEARGFFAATHETFDIIQFPPVGGFGAAGSDASQESYNYTTQSICAMLGHLKPAGILALTRGINTPPREELRAFDLAVQSLRAEGLEPATRLAMIRGSFSCTILLTRDPFTPTQIAAINEFCRKKSFDPCYYPGLTFDQANPNSHPKALGPKLPPPPPEYGIYNSVDNPFYSTGTAAMLGTPAERAKFLADYDFEISAPSDNHPYFFHTFRWSAYAGLQQKYGSTSHAFLEVSTNMLVVALAQSIVLAILLIVLPLAPGIGALRRVPRKLPALGYFLMIGLGFMLLEMSLVQKLVLYLAHPIYAAAVAIASFLLFAGIGSGVSKSWKSSHRRTVTSATLLVLLYALALLFTLDSWFNLTTSFPLSLRCLIAALTIAPLAFAMGHLFPLGLTRVADAAPPLVPWCWAVNGFASVAAASAAPLLAMQVGFAWLVIVAVICYVLAAWFFTGMGQSSTTPAVSETAPSAANVSDRAHVTA